MGIPDRRSNHVPCGLDSRYWYLVRLVLTFRKDLATMIASVLPHCVIEAQNSLRLYPQGRCGSTGDVSSFGLLRFRDRTPLVSSGPEWAARKETPARLHPATVRLNFDQVSVNTVGQVVRQPTVESEWSAYGRASKQRSKAVLWAGLITLGNTIV